MRLGCFNLTVDRRFRTFDYRELHYRGTDWFFRVLGLWIVPFLAISGFVFGSSRLAADVVWLKGQDQPHFGRIVEVNQQKLVFDLRRDDREGYDRRTYPIDSVADWVITIDESRLEKLDPRQPGGYRDYAEELVDAKADPEAQALAVRLLTIAAYHADQLGDRDLRDSALRNLAAASRSELERRRVERLGRVYGLFQGGQNNEGTAETTLGDSGGSLERLVKALRTEKWQTAAEWLEQGSLQRSWEAAQLPLEWGDLLRMVDDKTIRPAALESLVWIELAVAGDPPPRSPDDLSWAAQATRDDFRDRLCPDLLHWSRFDPRHSIYRGGRWVVPETGSSPASRSR